MAVVQAANEAALGAAIVEDLEVATATTPDPMTAVDLVAAAKIVQETLALCGARDARLAGVETKLVERERRVTERDEATAAREASVAKSEQELRGERQRVEALATKAQKAEHDLQAREGDLRRPELNAEAGFAAERRNLLQQLEAEAAILREELTRARTQIAKERADWDAHWRVEDERIREEQRQALVIHEGALAESERISRDQQRVDLEKFTQERADLKKRSAQIEEDRVILLEDREAFEVRVARKAAALLEEAKGKHQDLEARLASARAERDALFDQLRQRDEAERLLGNRPLKDVKQELDTLVHERDSLKSQLAKRPSNDVMARLEVLERAQEEWDAERARLTQEALDHILATKLLRKVRDRHDTRPEDLDALRVQIAEAWPRLGANAAAPRSAAIIRDELRRLGADEEV
ncbi:MAG: hypothetical protein H0W08_24815 [Acidobacteria bacterium]|nr:hypothetical protein [Acidobacteriota bacterium]